MKLLLILCLLSSFQSNVSDEMLSEIGLINEYRRSLIYGQFQRPVKDESRVWVLKDYLPNDVGNRHLIKLLVFSEVPIIVGNTVFQNTKDFKVFPNNFMANIIIRSMNDILKKQVKKRVEPDLYLRSA